MKRGDIEVIGKAVKGWEREKHREISGLLSTSHLVFKCHSILNIMVINHMLAIVFDSASVHSHSVSRIHYKRGERDFFPPQQLVKHKKNNPNLVR